jgi:hypothetical protein
MNLKICLMKKFRDKKINITTQEAEIRRIMVRSQPGQIVRETLSQKNPSQKKGCGVAQGVGPEFKC